MHEHDLEFPCFGSTVRLRIGHPDAGLAHDLLLRAKATAEDVHTTLSRFEPDSELSRLNTDTRTTVPASPLLRRFASAVIKAGRLSDGLVDATVLDAVIAAGYDQHWQPGASMSPARPPSPRSTAGWSTVRVTRDAIIRPPGVQLDSGGLGKGLAADLIAERFAPYGSWLVDCGGDLRLGGTTGLVRPVEVKDPDDPELVVDVLRLRAGGVATSGTTRRRWSGGHHLIDPRTGAPADTDISQATAVAPTALLAEIRAKAALLSGTTGARHYLPDGGRLVTAERSPSPR